MAVDNCLLCNIILHLNSMCKLNRKQNLIEYEQLPLNGYSRYYYIVAWQKAYSHLPSIVLTESPYYLSD
jgi:hypothetical protein